eukprot:gene1362-57246_t
MPRAKEDDARPFSYVEQPPALRTVQVVDVEEREPSPPPRGVSMDREELAKLPMKELKEYALTRGVEEAELELGHFTEKQQLIDAICGERKSEAAEAAAAAFAAAGFAAKKPEPKPA